MTSLPPYSGPSAKCPKCRAACLATTYHPCRASVWEKTPRGGGWPCQRFRPEDMRVEHLCRHCRNCGYARAEALAADPAEATEGQGAR